jgi:hypothetical protein
MERLAEEWTKNGRTGRGMVKTWARNGEEGTNTLTNNESETIKARTRNEQRTRQGLRTDRTDKESKERTRNELGTAREGFQAGSRRARSRRDKERERNSVQFFFSHPP